MAQHSPKLTPPVGERDHTWGLPEAAVTLVEYGDFECPHCGRAHPIVQQLQRLLAGTFRFVYRHFPLTQAHPHAERAAEAAEAAGAQGKFWDMHDQLFEHQSALEDDDLISYAKHLRIDQPRFARDMQEHKYHASVREDFLSGARSGVNGTPTFFINGVRHDGAWDLANLTAAIKQAAGHALIR